MQTAYLVNIIYTKCFILSPEILLKEDIEFTIVIQNPGEIIFTLYGAYHWGFNGGFNVCESSNLASPMYKEIHSESVNCAKSCPYGKDTNTTHDQLSRFLGIWGKKW